MLIDFFNPKSDISSPDPLISDESHGIQFEGIMRQPEWQTKTVRSSSKSAVKGSLGMQKMNADDRSKKSDSSGSKKLNSKKFGLSTNANSKFLFTFTCTGRILMFLFYQ